MYVCKLIRNYSLVSGHGYSVRNPDNRPDDTGRGEPRLAYPHRVANIPSYRQPSGTDICVFLPYG